MALTTEIVTTAVCDLCSKNIPTSVESYIDAMTYGAAFHTSCVTDEMFRILCVLGLDDIRLVHVDGITAKYIYEGR